MKASIALSKEDLEKELKFNVRSLGVDKLKTIYYVGLTESMTKAGDLMGLCQSAVSRQIQTLEDDLGFIMFKRKDRKVEITKEGKIMMQLSQKSLYEMDATVKSIKEAKEGLSGALILRTSPSMANTWVPYYLQGFQERYPEIHIKIEIATQDILLVDADVAIRTYVPESPNLSQNKLFDNTMGLFASQDYISKYGAPKSLEDLENHKLLALDRSLEKYYDYVNWILKVGIQDKMCYRSPCMELPSNDAMTTAMMHGLGIAALGIHRINLFKLNNVVRVLPNVKSEPIGVYFVYNGGIKEPQKYEALYNFITEKIREHAQFYE